MNTTGEGVVCNACPVGRSTNGESAQATCLRCSVLNSQDEKDWGKLTPCNPEMACGAVGGQVRIAYFTFYFEVISAISRRLFAPLFFPRFIVLLPG